MRAWLPGMRAKLGGGPAVTTPFDPILTCPSCTSHQVTEHFAGRVVFVHQFACDCPTIPCATEPRSRFACLLCGHTWSGQTTTLQPD